MKIRSATKFDQADLDRMILDYRQYSPIPSLRDAEDLGAFHTICAEIFAGRGQIWVAEKDSQLIGMLIAYIVPNLWAPNLLSLNELAYWVDPEHRGSSAGYRLLKEYKTYGDQCKAQGRIDYYTISKMVNSPDLRYDKWGFEKVEEMWRS